MISTPSSSKIPKKIILHDQNDMPSLNLIETPKNISKLKYISKQSNNIIFHHKRHYSAFEFNYYHHSFPKLKLTPGMQSLSKNKSSINLTPKNKQNENNPYKNTETLIDFVNSVKEFFLSKKSILLVKYSPIQYLNYENIKQSYLIRYTSPNLQNILSEESVSCVHIDINSENNHTWLFCGLNSGSLRIFSIEKDAIIAKYRSEKNLNNIPITSITYDSFNHKVVIGFKNGNVIVYDITKLSRPKIIINFNLSKDASITHVVPFSIGNNNGTKSFGFFALDSKGKVFRIYLNKNRLGFITNDTVVLFQNNINTYYNISLYKLNPNLFAIGDCTMIKVVKYSELKLTNTNIIHKIKSLLEIRLTKNDIQTHLPSFKFLGNSLSINSPMFCIAINNSVLTYTINQFNLALTLERSFSFTNSIIDIGSFSLNSLYVIDSLFKLYNIDVLNNKTYDSDVDLSDLNIKPNKQIICISNSEGGKILPVYFNVFHSIESKSYFYIKTENNITCIMPINIKDYLTKLKNDNSISNEDKWTKIFSLLISIKTFNHPVYQYHNYNNELSEIAIELSDYLLNKCFDSSKEEVVKEVNLSVLLSIMINTLFEFKLINYITIDLRMFFKNVEETSRYFELLEPHILRDKLLSKSVPVDFILELIDFYTQNNKKQKLAHLIIHFDNNIITTDDKIYAKVFSNKFIYLMLDISLQNQSKNYFKPIEYIVNELNYIQMNNGITFSITQINQNINLNEIIYDDNIFLTFHYMKLEILWYIIKLIDSRGNDIINNEQTQIVEFFLSEKIFDFYCLISSLQKEFFYVIKYIIIKCDVNKVRRKLIESNYDKCNNLVYNSDNEKGLNDIILKEFYILCLFTFVNYPMIDFRNEIKIKTLLYLLKYNYIMGEDISEIENMIIQVLKDIDYITNDDSITLLKEGENSILSKVKVFISENIHV